MQYLTANFKKSHHLCATPFIRHTKGNDILRYTEGYSNLLNSVFQCCEKVKLRREKRTYPCETDYPIIS